MVGLKTSAEDLAARRQQRRTQGLLSAPQPVAAAGPTTTVATAVLAPHPANRRTGLGDLSDIAQSMRSLGVLEPLVVTTRAAHLAAHPDHANQIGDAEYVIICGHRRFAAASSIDLQELPVSVQSDLSRDGRDIQAMIVENARRASLTPIDEARGFAALMDLGFEQGQIAEAVGSSQGQISRRLSLLRLPEPVQAALVADKITVSDALAIGRLKDAEHQLAAWRAIEQRLNGLKDPQSTERARAVAEVVALQRQSAAYEQRAQASRTRAGAEGIRVVDPVAEWGSTAALRRLDDENAITVARDAGDLAAALDQAGGLYYVYAGSSLQQDEPVVEPAAPAAVRDAPAPRTASDVPARPAAVVPDLRRTETQERSKAERAREAACRRVVARKPSATEALRRVVTCVVQLGASADAQRLAHRWLRAEQVGPQVDTVADYVYAVLTDGGDLLIHIAYATALAGDELHTRRQREIWDDRARTHLHRLMTDAEYIPTAYEARSLESTTNSPVTGG